MKTSSRTLWGGELRTGVAVLIPISFADAALLVGALLVGEAILEAGAAGC